VRYGNAGNVQADNAHISLSGAASVEGDTVELRQAGAQSVVGNQVDIRQGGAVQIQAESLSMTQGAVVFAETGKADLMASNVGAIVAGGDGDVNLDQCITRAVITRGDVTMDQSGSGVIVGRNITTGGDNSGTILMLAGRVNGNVNAVFGPASSAAFGASFALVIALILWIRRRLMG
jgi:ribosomal protein L27